LLVAIAYVWRAAAGVAGIENFAYWGYEQILGWLEGENFLVTATLLLMFATLLLAGATVWLVYVGRFTMQIDTLLKLDDKSLTLSKH
jgi:hypothetical protein